MCSRHAGLAALVALLAAASPARADQHFVFPEVGLGLGHLAFRDSSRLVTQTSLHLGSLYDQTEAVAAGWLFHLAYLDSVGEVALAFPYRRVTLTPMACVSLGYRAYSPFVHLAVGPQLALSSRQGAWETDWGGGVAVELALGIKDAVELYAQASVAFARQGPSLVATGGLRLNALLFLWLVGVVGGHGSDWALPPREHESHHASPVETPVHQASPVGSR